MRGGRHIWSLVSFAIPAALVCAADLPSSTPILPAGPGVTPPRPVYKQEPEYSAEALGAEIQGKVVCEVVISDAGKPTGVAVISPLGFGLDEKAEEAIEAWRFEPGRKNGKPVNVRTTIEVDFTLPGRRYNRGAEERRTQFNIVLRELNQANQARREKAVKTLQDLARKKFPPAMYVLGRLMRAGQGVPKDLSDGEALIHKAAEKNYGPALFEVGLADYKRQETQNGLRLIRDAAVLGSQEAQLFLGDRDERGVDTPVDLSRARRYFGLCAAAGQPVCQLRLGKLLLRLPDRDDREYVQALAWLELAADRGQEEARSLLQEENAHLTAEQSNWVKRLKPQLVQRQ